MKKIKPIILTLLFITISLFQSKCSEIRGKVMDSKKQTPIYGAYVSLYQNNTILETVLSDFDGNFIFKNCDSGLFHIVSTARILGYETFRLNNIIMRNENPINLEIKLVRSTAIRSICCCRVVRTVMTKEPVLQVIGNTTTYSMDRIQAMPYYPNFKGPSYNTKNAKNKKSKRTKRTKKDTKKRRERKSNNERIDTISYLPKIICLKKNQIDSSGSSTKQNVDSVQSNVFHAYPNPSDGQLTIEVSQDVEVIYLSNASGKELERIKFFKGQTKCKVTLEKYPNGIYVLRAWQNKQWTMQKIILNK